MKSRKGRHGSAQHSFVRRKSKKEPSQNKSTTALVMRFTHTSNTVTRKNGEISNAKSIAGAVLFGILRLMKYFCYLKMAIIWLWMRTTEKAKELLAKLLT